MTGISREFDLIIFGATGFTGYYVIRELLLSIEQNPKENGKIRWAIAGRNIEKLKLVLNKVMSELSEIKFVPEEEEEVVKIVANVEEPKSLREMARRTRLVINVVGPFGLFGKPVVDACVESGTDYIDISGEPEFNDLICLDYHQKAIDNKSLVISGCAFDSIPSDYGVQFMKDKFDGRLHSVESYFSFHFGDQGYRFNRGTFLATITAIRRSIQMALTNRRLHQEVLTEKMPQSKIPLSYSILPFKRPELSGWSIPFPGPDLGVVERSQYYNYHTHNEMPVQFRSYFTVQSFYSLIGIFLLFTMISLFSLLSFTRRLMEKYPELFTFGLVSNQGPSREQIDGTRFEMYLFGRGWFHRSTNAFEEPGTEPENTITVLVSGPDPGYVGTASLVVQSGLTILNDRDKIVSGGVLTPASAFRSTKLLERLESRNIQFKVISSS